MSDAAAIARLAERLSSPISFEPRDAPIPADVRVIWRLPLLLFTLAAVRGGRASWMQLHLLSSAVRTEIGRERVDAALRGETHPDEPVARFEPGLDAAVRLAVGLGLAVWRQGRRLELTPSGETVVGELRNQDVLLPEQEFLRRIAPRLSMAATVRILGG